MKHATNSISVEGLGKRYRLGTIGRHTLAEELQFWTLKALGRDPAHRMGVVNDKAPATPRRRLAAQLDPDHAGLFWALRDVSFTVRPGEMLGVIGPNGAGKSTLLKILARVTEPTEGRARIVGRLSSLLEVGTGFHPELTGRENVFVNGAILGMTADEIRRKYETIVEFADMQDFIDTPVKRYSSGMRTRLAFAVAAHLEPDVLLLDEVLSVGDAAFQEKCAKKMKQIVGRGRTVLLVSHRTSTVSDLCQRVIWIDRGRIRQEGTAEAVVTDYLTAS
jgi:lipopolysaccharide transport system ATP-binding protein